jgi:hypothetical protein
MAERGHLNPTLFSDEILFLRYAFERFSRRLDAVERITAFRWEKSHDLVLPRRGRHAGTSGVVVNNLPDFEFVLPCSVR